MAGNSELIDEVVDPVVKTQISDLQAQLAALDKQLVDTTKHTISLNNATGNTKSFTELTKVSQTTALGQERLQQAYNKTAVTATNLEKAHVSLTQAQTRQAAQQERAAAAAQKALSPYQQLSKELDNMRAKAKDAGAQFGTNSQQFKDASKPVQDLDAKLKGIDESLGQSQRNVGNYGRAFSEAFSQYIPFIGGTIRVKENLKDLTETIGVSEEKLGTLGGAFANFAVGGFAIAIGLAINYLSQFQGYADKMDIFFAGIKGRINELGKDLVETVAPDPGKETGISKFVQKYKEALQNTPIGALFTKLFIDTTQNASDAAEAVEKLNIKLRDEGEILAVLNGRDQAASDNLRALADDKNQKYLVRKNYLDKAEALDQQILKRSKEDANNQLNAAIQSARSLKAVTDSQVDELRKGNIKLATELSVSTNPKNQISKIAYDSLVKAYQAQNQVEEQQTQNLQKIRNDRSNLEIRDERELAKALEGLDASRLQGQQLQEKLIIDDDNKNYDTKLSALDAYVKNSKKLADIKLADDLAAAKVPGRAGLDPKVVAAKEAKAYQDHQNELTKIDADGLKQRQDLEKKETDRGRKNLQDLLAANKNAETKAIADAQELSNTKLDNLEKEFDKQAALIDSQYSKGEIDQKTAHDKLLRLEDQYNVNRLTKELTLQKTILEIKQAALANNLATAKNRGDNPDQLQEIISQSGVSQQQNVVAKAGNALGKALTKQGTDDSTLDRSKAINDADEFGKAVGYAQQAQAAASKLIQGEYEAEIELLEKKKQLIEDQAKAEVDAVNTSILSQADKQRKINIINAQTAQQEKQIQQQQQKVKEQEAVYDRALAITNIVENTTVGATKALAQGGGLFGPGLAGIVIALGAVELATLLATPLPKFEKGTKSSPEGWAHVGERGPELMIDPSGKMSLTPGTDTLTYLQKGTQVIPNHMIRPEKLNYAGAQQVPWNAILAQLKRNKPIEQKRPIVRVNVNNDPYYNKFYR